MITKNTLKEKKKTEIEKVIYQDIQQLLGYIKREDEKIKDCILTSCPAIGCSAIGAITTLICPFLPSVAIKKAIDYEVASYNILTKETND